MLDKPEHALSPTAEEHLGCSLGCEPDRVGMCKYPGSGLARTLSVSVSVSFARSPDVRTYRGQARAGWLADRRF